MDVGIRLGYCGNPWAPGCSSIVCVGVGGWNSRAVEAVLSSVGNTKLLVYALSVTSDTSDDAPARLRRDRGWVKDVTIPLLVALVALLGTWLGSSQTLKSSQESLQKQSYEDRTKADRERRSEIYLQLLATAQEFGDELRTRIDSCMQQRSPGLVTITEELTRDCSWQAYQGAKVSAYAFVAAHAKVYIYGSDAAADAANKLASAFPGEHDPGADPLIIHVREFKWVLFNTSYVEFQQVACKELPAIPRARC